MQNIIECVQSREWLLSDIPIHRRANTTCHRANLGIRLNRTVDWEPKKRVLADDQDAAGSAGNREKAAKSTCNRD